MKQNPKTKALTGNKIPVIRCRAIRRRKMNGSTDAKAWGAGAILIPQEKMDMDEMAAITQERCTVTQTDVHAAWSALQSIIAEALANGKRVELGELGILSLNVRAKQLKELGEHLRATDMEVGTITLKPGPLLQQLLNRVTFKIDNTYSEPTDAESLDMALYKYFGEDGHMGITVKRFGDLCGYRETAARALLKEYIAQGVMEHVPMSRGYYRPTKGNFGW